MNDDLESTSLFCAFGSRLVLVFRLFENTGNLVADSSGLKPAAVRQRRIIWCRGRKMPFLVSSVKAVAVPRIEVS